MSDQITKIMDEDKLGLLALLDLSSTAFDTVDRNILLTRRGNSFGFKDGYLSWIRSYPRGRLQYVLFNGESSARFSANGGVPQGWVLGPLSFVIYKWKNGYKHYDIAFLCQWHTAANQWTPIWHKITLHSKLTLYRRHDAWMVYNRHKLNQSKADVLWCITTIRLKTLTHPNLSHSSIHR